MSKELCCAICGDQFSNPIDFSHHKAMCAVRAGYDDVQCPCGESGCTVESPSRGCSIQNEIGQRNQESADSESA